MTFTRPPALAWIRKFRRTVNCHCCVFQLFALEFGVSEKNKKKKTKPHWRGPGTQPGAHHQAVARGAGWDKEVGRGAWGTGLHLIPVWGTLTATGLLLGSIWWKLNPPPNTHNFQKYFQFGSVVRWAEVPGVVGKSVQTQAHSGPRLLRGRVHQQRRGRPVASLAYMDQSRTNPALQMSLHA